MGSDWRLIELQNKIEKNSVLDPKIRKRLWFEDRIKHN